MATSGVISNTPYGIIEDAMRAAGYLAEGDLPTSNQLAEYMRRLNDLVNVWQTQGLKLWLLQDLSISLVAGQNLYTIGPATGNSLVMNKPTQVIDSAYVLNPTTNIRRPLVPLSWAAWMKLSQVTGNNGTISSYFVDMQSAVLNLWVWNTPDTLEAANSVHILIRQQVNNSINLEQSTQFPQEWRIALVWGLADEICTGQPQAIMLRCAQRALAYRTLLEDYEVEMPDVRFSLDSRYTQSRRRFGR